MWLHYIEDELASPFIPQSMKGVVPPGTGFFKEGDVTTEDVSNRLANIRFLLGSSDEGWDWALHNMLADASAKFGRPVIELPGFEGDAIALGVFERILLQLEAVAGRCTPLLKLVEEHQDALSLLTPRTVRDWLPGSTVPLPYPPGVLPELEDTSFVDSMLNELSSFLVGALGILRSSAGRIPIIGITNAQWFDKLSMSLVSRLCRSAPGQQFEIYIHLDDERADNPLLRLAKALGQFGWATVCHACDRKSATALSPLRERDAHIAACATSGSADDKLAIRLWENTSETNQKRLLIAAFANCELLETELEATATLLAGTGATGEMPENRPAALCSRAYIIHPSWKRILRAKMCHQVGPILSAVARQQYQKHGPILNWLRSTLHLLAQEGRWPEWNGKIPEYGFYLYEQFGERKAAITFYETARSQRCDDVALIAHLAWLYSFEKDTQKALQLYDEALALYCPIPLRILMLCRVAVLHAKTGDWIENGAGLLDEAVALTSHLNDWIESLEAKARIANAGAFVLYRAGQLSESLDVLRDADVMLAGAPSALLQLRFLVRKNIAKVLQKKGGAACEVIDAYQHIMGLCPDRRDPEQLQYRVVSLFAMAIVQAEAGRPATADHYFRAVVELPYPAFRMSVPALCRYAYDLFARLGYYDYASKWAETQIKYYLASNRPYDAFTSWRTYAKNSLAEQSSIAIPIELQGIASCLKENDGGHVRTPPPQIAASDSTGTFSIAAVCPPMADHPTAIAQVLAGRQK